MSERMRNLQVSKYPRGRINLTSEKIIIQQIIFFIENIQCKNLDNLTIFNFLQS